MTDSRVIILLLDGVGCGELPDAATFGDTGSNTLGNLSRAVGGLAVPNLARLGLGHITTIEGVPPAPEPAASFGRMAEQSCGKDSTNGHWEISGVISNEPFPVFPNGFPRDIIRRFELAIGRRTIGNCAASGTEIIERLGTEHVRTRCPIVYTSADSVFQVACHESVMTAAELYRVCEKARALFDGPYRVARVIARPFTGRAGSYKRTPGRKDFSCAPPKPTLLDNVKDAGLPSVGIGKIDDLFANRGLTRCHHSVNNAESLDLLFQELDLTRTGLVFTNLVQFDMDWGHRNDPPGFAAGLAEFDAAIPDIEKNLRPGDLLFITADHGNDPTTSSTDHSREYVPLLVLGPGLRRGQDLGTRATFADLGQTAAEHLGVAPTPDGACFLAALRPESR